eukprot:scaffold11835_cov34-Prasinocladus_malaysianus.AAC.5
MMSEGSVVVAVVDSKDLSRWSFVWSLPEVSSARVSYATLLFRSQRTPHASMATAAPPKLDATTGAPSRHSAMLFNNSDT